MAKKRNGEIDCLRFLFAVIILIHHFDEVFPVGLFGNGYIGVEFFFLVAGFLMAQKVKRMQNRPETSAEMADATWQFIMRKVASFYPYYFCALMIRLVLFGVILDYKGIREIISILCQSIPSLTLTVFALNFSCPFLYDSTFWFLSAMLIAMFFLYPILLKDWDRACKLVFPAMSLLLLGYLNEVYGHVSTFSKWTGICYTGVLRAGAQLALGASLYALSEWMCIHYRHLLRGENRWMKAFFTVVKAGCYGMVLLFILGCPMENLHAFLFLIIGVLLSFSEAGYTVPGGKLTQYLGKISLPIYIFHGLMREAAGDLLAGWVPTAGMVLVMSGCSLLLCVLLMYATDLMKKWLFRMMHCNGFKFKG